MGCGDITSLLTLKAKIRSQLNSKSRKKAYATRRLFTKRRSSFFDSTFKDIEGIIDATSGAVSRDPAMALATHCIFTTFFKPYIPAPAHTSHPTTTNWLTQPQWFRSTFHTSLHPVTNPIFDNILTTSTPLDL
jgi:hypothetical protein